MLPRPSPTLASPPTKPQPPATIHFCAYDSYSDPSVIVYRESCDRRTRWSDQLSLLRIFFFFPHRFAPASGVYRHSSVLLFAQTASPSLPSLRTVAAIFGYIHFSRHRRILAHKPTRRTTFNAFTPGHVNGVQGNEEKKMTDSSQQYVSEHFGPVELLVSYGACQASAS